MTKIIITGCNGRMGQMITDIVTEDNDAVIVAGVDIVNNRNNSYPVFTDISDCDIMADVIIDVSSSQGIEEGLVMQWTSIYLLLYVQQACRTARLHILQKQAKKLLY